MKGLRYILLVLLVPLVASGCSTTGGINKCGLVGGGVGGATGALVAEKVLAGIVPGVIVGTAVGHMLCWNGDSDGDGVLNTEDQCPDTPKGAIVDKNGCPDADMDGVTDDMDKCPGTPEGISVDQDGCPPDGDQDGVPDYRDDCLHTPSGVEVNDRGCARCGELLATVSNVNFDFNQAGIRSDATGTLATVVEALGNTSTKVRIEGHTDSIGSDKYNDRLSEQRARAVSDYLTSQGVSPSSITGIIGMGEGSPVADNKTEEGRAQNRRVEILKDCPSY